MKVLDLKNGSKGIILIMLIIIIIKLTVTQNTHFDVSTINNNKRYFLSASYNNIIVVSDWSINCQVVKSKPIIIPLLDKEHFLGLLMNFSLLN